MRAALIVLAGLLVLQGSWAQECDRSTSGTALIDLLGTIGQLACKVPPSVDLTEVMRKLTGTLNNLDSAQLQQLPSLLELLGDVDPSALTPFLSLSSDELARALPVLAEVPVETLKVALPLLAKQDISVVQRVISFLKKIPLSKLQQLSPLFGRITQGQVNILLHALNVLPDHAIDLLIHMVQALGPVTDAGVAVKQHLGLFPNVRITANKGSGSGSASASTSHSAGVMLAPHISISSAPAPTSSHQPKSFAFKIGGRKLAQSAQGACDPGNKGLEIGAPLLGDFGSVVCKFGPDTLKPVLEKTLNILLKQTTEQLARLPQLADTMASVDPKTLSAISAVPQATLRQLIPVLSGIDPAKVTAQLKLLGQQDKETIDKMIYFLKATPPSQMEILVGMFAKMTDKQVEQMAKLLNALSPGQIFLMIHLLDAFGFAVDAIGQHIPPSSARGGKSFMIGPVRVVYDH